MFFHTSLEDCPVLSLCIYGGTILPWNDVGRLVGSNQHCLLLSASGLTYSDVQLGETVGIFQRRLKKYLDLKSENLQI